MSEYMEQMAQNQIEAGLSEREQLIERVEHLESELKKRDELLRGALEYLESVGMYGLSKTDSKDCRRKANEIKAILEGK